MRTTPATQTLQVGQIISGKPKMLGIITYNPPKKKMPSTLSRCMAGICRFQTIGIGVNRIRKSVATLAAALPTKNAEMFIHCPVAVGSTY